MIRRLSIGHSLHILGIQRKKSQEYVHMPQPAMCRSRRNPRSCRPECMWRSRSGHQTLLEIPDTTCSRLCSTRIHLHKYHLHRLGSSPSRYLRLSKKFQYTLQSDARRLTEANIDRGATRTTLVPGGHGVRARVTLRCVKLVVYRQRVVVVLLEGAWNLKEA